MKQAMKKGAGITPTSRVAAFKNKNGMSGNNADKELSWITMPPAFVDALRLPGFPIGYISSIIGHSNTGKSTLVNHALTEAQRMGVLPVIIDTENNFDFSYAIDMGFKAEPVIEDVTEEVLDPETGEVKTVTNKKITNYDGDFLYVNSAILADMYGDEDYSTGKKTSTKRNVALIEDVAKFVTVVLDAQDNGEFGDETEHKGILFVWDSVNSVGSYQGYKSQSSNNMWNAAAIENSFREIFNSRIPCSRKVGQKYTNTMILVQKVSVEMSPTGIASAKGKGGKELTYTARLQIFVGGVKGAGTKTLSAISKGVSYSYGTETKLKSPKNQLPNPYCIASEGKVVCTATGIIKPTDVDEYRKKNLPSILKKLNEKLTESDNETVGIEDIQFTETENAE